MNVTTENTHIEDKTKTLLKIYKKYYAIVNQSDWNTTDTSFNLIVIPCNADFKFKIAIVRSCSLGYQNQLAFQDNTGTLQECLDYAITSVKEMVSNALDKHQQQQKKLLELSAEVFPIFIQNENQIKRDLKINTFKA